MLPGVCVYMYIYVYANAIHLEYKETLTKLSLYKVSPKIREEESISNIRKHLLIRLIRL